MALRKTLSFVLAIAPVLFPTLARAEFPAYPEPDLPVMEACPNGGVPELPARWQATALMAPYLYTGKPNDLNNLSSRAELQVGRFVYDGDNHLMRGTRYGAKLESFDEAAVKALPGVVAVVRDGSFLGVIAAREEQAIKARDALKRSARWSGGEELPDPAKIHEHLLTLSMEDKVISDKQAPLPDGATRVEATYHRPYTAHASIGPSCSVAQAENGKITVWTHTQGVFPLRATMAKALDMQPSAIRCIHVEGSGCYGHNAADDVALDAALLARAAAGKPVRVQLMRDDEFMWDLLLGERYEDPTRISRQRMIV